MKKSLSIILALIMALTLVTAAFAETYTLPSGAGTSTVYGPLTAYASIDSPNWGSGVPSVATWKHNSWPVIGSTGAQWISSAYNTEQPVAVASWRKFTTTQPLCTGAYGVSVTVTATADNAEQVWINGIYAGGDGEVTGTSTDNQEWNTVKSYYSAILKTDQVVVDFIVRNYAYNTTSPQANPTGLIYTIVVDYSCPVEVDIDIKPGSYPSCFNNDGSGVIPVAINGSASFDVNTVDPGSVTLGSLVVAVKGKSDKLMAAYEDWNMDGFLDLVLKMVDDDDTFSKGSGTATINGSLYSGVPFYGTGDICITQ